MAEGILQDGNGKTSSTRLITLFMCLVIIIIWGVISLKENALSDIPQGVIWMFYGLLFFGAVRKVIEAAGPDLLKAMFKRGS